MTWSFGPLALVVAAAVLVVLGLLYSETLRTKLYPPDKFWPYYARKVLNPPELALYQRLRDALPERLILAQVPLSRVLGVRETLVQKLSAMEKLFMREKLRLLNE